MAIEIRVPRLGWSMEVGTFIGWLKQDGEFVDKGDALYELEGEKASQEIESIDAGVLRIPPDAPVPGTELPVGALLAYLVETDESPPWEVDSDTTPVSDVTKQAQERTAGPAPSSPSVRKLAQELGVPLNQVEGSGRCGRISREDVERFAQASCQTAKGPVASLNATRNAASQENGSAVVSTPRARRVAAELGVDWAGLTGTGKQGRIRERDVQLAAASRHAASVTGPTPNEPSPAQDEVIPISKLRRRIAQRLVASHQTTAPVTLTTRADAANLLSTRDQFKTASDPCLVPSLNDIIIKLTARILQRHAVLAGRWHEDGIVLPAPDGINIGLAVDTPKGLLVPVIHNVAQKSLLQIAETTRQLINQAQSGTLSLDHLQGGVFTVTNLGSYGIDAFTPVINSPESAILGIGAVRREAIIQDDDRISIGTRMTLSLTFDHRVVDGAPAARFLADLRTAIENPVPQLV